MKNGLLQIIRMEEFIRIKRVKECFSTVQVAQFIININMSLGKTFLRSKLIKRVGVSMSMDRH